MRIYRIKMLLNTYFLYSNLIVSSDLEFFENYIIFNTNKISLNFLKKSNVEYILEKNEIKYIGRRFFNIKGILIGIFLFLFLIYINSFRVSRIEFNNKYVINDEIEEYIISNTKKIFNSNFINKDLSYLEEELRHKYINYQWISIKKTSSVIYVTISDFDESKISSNIGVPGNIIASCDGIIKSLKVYKGISLVKENDYVKKGDLLINGILDDNNKVESHASVIAECFYKVKKEVFKEENVSQLTGNVKKYYKIKILNKSFIFGSFKGYNKCDKREENKFSLSKLFNVKLVTESEKCDIIKTYDRSLAIDYVSETVKSEFLLNKVSDREEIINILPLVVIENENSFTIELLVKARVSIGIFEKVGE